MSTTTLTMPRRSGTRSSARAFVEETIPFPVAGPVTLDAHAMEASSQSFADELIGRVLGDRRAARLVVLSPTSKFATCLQHSAEVRGISDRLDIVERRA